MSNQSRRLLIADDCDLVRRGLRTLLETRRQVEIVAEARNGRLALEEARATSPDIAIIDFTLPELNGLDLTRALKREMPQIEVLIFTSLHSEELIFDVLRAGARGYVLKSESDQHLLAALDALSINRPYFSGIVSETMRERLLGSSRSGRISLTHREREVVQLIAEGRINKQIAHRLDISVKTVETHRAAAMDKLHLRNTAELVRYALRNNIVQA